MPRKKSRTTTAPQSQPDPHARRESERYERPIASREHIGAVIGEADRPLNRDELATLLGIDSEDGLEALRRRLNAMTRDGQLVRNRRDCYAPAERLDLVAGRVIAHPDGYGFLVRDEGDGDLYLSARQMRALIHGDRALVRIIGVDSRGRREGAVVEILQRNTHSVVGRFLVEHGVQFVVPDSRRLPSEIAVPAGATAGAQHGQIVVVEIIEQPTKRSPPLGRVVEVLGDHMAPGMEIDIAIRSHEIPQVWPAGVEQETARFGTEVPAAAGRGRTDLRAVPLVTIDGADARDFDDAVYCERTPGGWRLLVAIADVSHYVQPDTALDRAARERGNSVYFPERVIPMLPEALSNGLCSINPDVDRLCLVCEILFRRDGSVVRARFFDGLMRSHARLTYAEAASIMVERDAQARARRTGVAPHLDELYHLYRVLRKARERRGAVDFETTETRIVFGADRKIERIVPLVRNDAHKLIEECMIAANVAAARLLERHRMPTLYRVHAVPAPEKLSELQEFLGELGLELRGGSKPSGRDFAMLLERVRERPDAHLINTVLLRSLPRAEYNPANIGHFGLAHDSYVHFTSPIRRYPDLLVHRAIRHVLAGGKPDTFPYRAPDMAELGGHCSATERRADEATRDAIDWLKCEFMLDKVGETYDGIISSVTSFGIFVELREIYVEGLVHVTALGDDFYHYEPARHWLVGERTRRMFRLGDQVSVKVVRVDLDERKIDFELDGRTGSRRGGARRTGPGGTPKPTRPGSAERGRRKAGLRRKGRRSRG
jgi:ribonuclease R